MKQSIEELQALGLSRNEARVYLSLLDYHPVTGYELGKRTGIPRSVIYDVLNRLVERGAVYATAAEPVKYVPVPPAKFLDSLQAEFDRSVTVLREQLSRTRPSESLEYIYHLKGARNVRKEIRRLIDQAEHELLLELWLLQYEELREALRAAQRRGVRIFTMLFSGERTVELGHVFYHDYLPLEVVETRLKGRHAIVVRDNSETLIGKLIQEERSWAVITIDPILVMVAREFIIHDIMIDLLVREFGREQLDRVWLSHPDIHGIVLDRLSTASPGSDSPAGDRED